MSLQFVIFKPLSYYFEETIGFDVKASSPSCPVFGLIKWYSKPGDIAKEFREKAIQFHTTFYGMEKLSGYLTKYETRFDFLLALFMSRYEWDKQDLENTIVLTSMPGFTLVDFWCSGKINFGLNPLVNKAKKKSNQFSSLVSN